MSRLSRGFKWILGRPALLCWFMMMAIFVLFVGIDAIVTDDPANAPLMPGSTAWRGPFELLVILGVVLICGGRYSMRSLWAWFLLANVAAITLVMDNCWGMLVEWAGVAQWLPSYTMKPQDGVMILSGLVIIGLMIRLWRKGFDALVAGHLVLLVLSSAFLVLIHLVAIYGAGHPLAARGLESLSLKATNEFFVQECGRPGMGCYDGPWKRDSDYTITLSSNLSKFVYSQFIDTPDDKKVGIEHPDNAHRLGGLVEINEFSAEKPLVVRAWNTGWKDVSIIDQPEKYAVYYKNGDHVRVIVDYETAVYDKLQVNVVMRPLMTAFSLVWIITGICLLLMHTRFQRFSRKSD